MQGRAICFLALHVFRSLMIVQQVTARLRALDAILFFYRRWYKIDDKRRGTTEKPWFAEKYGGLGSDLKAAHITLTKLRDTSVFQSSIRLDR